jgi:carboxylesterase
MKPHDPSYFNCDVCKPFFQHGGRKGVVLIHGFSGSVAHMRPLGDALHALGYTVMGINLPGHATTEKDMARKGWKDWLRAAGDAVAYMRGQCDTLTVCGLSMGALLALLIAEQQKVDACISISAPIPQRNKLLPLTSLLWFLSPRIAWAPDEDRAIKLDQRYDKGYSGFPSRKGADLQKLIHMAKKSLYKITCPLLIVQSTDDKAVAQTSADTIFNGVQSERKEKLILHGVPHVCTISEELPTIVEASDALMKSLLLPITR